MPQSPTPPPAAQQTRSGTLLGPRETALHLQALSEVILAAWARRVEQEMVGRPGDDAVSLRHVLPAFLAGLAHALATGSRGIPAYTAPSPELEAASGDSRYSLDQVIHEYQLVREVILEKLDHIGLLTLQSRQCIHAWVDGSIRRTAVRFAEAEKRRSSERLSQVVEAMPQIVWTARPDGEITWYNQRWYDYTGEAPGAPWHLPGGPVHPDDVENTLKQWQRATASGDPVQLEFRLRSAQQDEFRWHLMRALPLRDATGTVRQWIGSSTDIHAYKTLLRDFEQERVLRDRFIAALTHDLRTPISVTKITAQLLQRKMRTVEQVQTMAGRIVVNMDRADRMIRDLLDANRIKAGEGIPIILRDARLDAILSGVVSDLVALHGPRFTLHSTTGPLHGQWDATAIQRVIENLVGNAIKYGKPDAPVDLVLRRQESFAEVAVHNQGEPISREDQRTLFQPYQRTRSALRSGQKGWGIGLTLVKGITEAHGGTVAVQSDPAEGTTFSIRLPLSATLPSPASAHGQAPEPR